MEGRIVVRADGVGKSYRLGELQQSYGLLRESIPARIGQLRRGRRSARPEEFWALRDVSFEVEQGETFGMIGHNGAGKSTLLKILSRVTPPTAGEIRLRGRVAALLEVGAGFHPELTGRENVYLNGAILGMSKLEITRKFDEMVAFAQVEQFLDTPVKRYSTGMYLRLAFAVAAHLEPEILIVDEVLSVGDLSFQRKCLGRMEAAASEGRTVLFVSQNLSAAAGLCERSMLLSGGRKVTEGPTDRVIEEYVGSERREARATLADRVDRQGTGWLRFQEAILEADGHRIDSPASGQAFDFVLRYETANGKPLRNVSFTVEIMTLLGETILQLSSHTAGVMLTQIPGDGEVRCTLPRCPLPAGQYAVGLRADIAREPLDWIERAIELTVHEGDFFGSGRSRLPSHPSVLVDHGWSVGSIGAAERSAMEL